MAKQGKRRGKERRGLRVDRKTALLNILLLMNHEDPSLYLDQDYSSAPSHDAYEVPSASSRVSDYVLILVLNHL